MFGPFLEELIMQSRALRSTIHRAFTVFALAGLAACSGSPVSPSATAGSGLNGIAADATSATPSASAGHAAPFKGTLEGAYTIEFPSPLILLVEGTGTGNATQLGQYTFDYDETVNLTTGAGTGTYEFTAANGDKLTADWTGAGFPTDDPTILRIVENATISGGTGRFANASGSFTVERLFSFVTSSGGGSFHGTIRLR
jgi:hypothetical protein